MFKALIGGGRQVEKPNTDTEQIVRDSLSKVEMESILKEVFIATLQKLPTQLLEKTSVNTNEINQMLSKLLTEHMGSQIAQLSSKIVEDLKEHIKAHQDRIRQEVLEGVEQDVKREIRDQVLNRSILVKNNHCRSVTIKNIKGESVKIASREIERIKLSEIDQLVITGRDQYGDNKVTCMTFNTSEVDLYEFILVIDITQWGKMTIEHEKTKVFCLKDQKNNLDI